MSNLTQSLLDTFKIRAAEKDMVALLTGLMFCAAAGGAIGSPGVEALFFSRFGVQFLPHMYIALGLVIVATSLGITALLGRFERSRLYTRLPLAMALILLISRLIVSFDLNWFYPFLWLGMNVYWSLLSLFTWGVAGTVCDTRQAKRLFPLFGAGWILGLTAGGLMTEPLVDWLGTTNLLFVWAASLLLAFYLSGEILRAFGRKSRSRFHEPPPLIQELQAGYHFARRSPLMRWMALAAVLFAVLYYSVVFPFSQAVAAEFPGEDDITAFLGVFQGASTGAAFLVSLFLANRLYARYGFMTAILAYPLLYFWGFSVLIVSPVFMVLVLFRFAQLLWSEGVSEGANQAMYNLVPPEEREQTRAFVRGVANPLGVSLVGGLLLLGQQVLPEAVMYATGLLAAGITAYLVWRARTAYGLALVEALRAGQPNLFFSEEQPFGGFRRDAAAVAALLEGISSPEVAVRRVSAEILANLALPEALEAVISGLDDPDAAVRAALLRALARAGAADAIPRVLPALQDPEPEVRLAAVGALRQLADDPSEVAGQLEPLLQDPDPAVRSLAAAGLLSAGPHSQAERLLRDQASQGDSQARLAALQALAEWGGQSAYEIAAGRLADPETAVRAAAAQVLSQIDLQQCVPDLVRLLGDDDFSVRQSSAVALGKSGILAVQPVLQALNDPSREAGALLALASLPKQHIQAEVLAYARDRVEKALAYHELRQASMAVGWRFESVQLLADSLRRESLGYAENALRAIAVLGDHADISLVIENLDSGDAGQRANALEALDALGQPELVGPLMQLWEPDGRKANYPEDWLLRLLQDERPWLRACAALAARDFLEAGVRTRLAELEQNDPDELVRATAHLTLTGENSMKTLATLSLMERILFLRRVPLFAGLPPAELKQVAAIAGEHQFADGEVIVQEGETGEEMFIIVSGQVRVVTYSETGEEVEIVRRMPGEFVGEMSIISRAPRMASLIAAGEVRSLCIEQADFEHILRQRPETSLAVMRVLIERLRECDEQIMAQ